MSNKISQFWTERKHRKVVPVITVFATAAVVIVVLIILNIIPRSDRINNKDFYDKSIVVLPFTNDNLDKDNEYFANGITNSIIANLAKMPDLKVVSRASAEQFCDPIISIPEVAEKLNVSYVLEGSMQKYGDQIRITLQLIDQHDRHLWSKQYDREIKEAEDYFAFPSEIAQLVAEEIDARINPQE